MKSYVIYQAAEGFGLERSDVFYSAAESATVPPSEEFVREFEAKCHAEAIEEFECFAKMERER